MPAHDMCKMTSTTTGTGTSVAELIAAAGGFQDFLTGGCVNNEIIDYGITDAGNTWEIGTSTYITNATGQWLSTRTVIASSAGGTTAITLSGGQFVYVAEIAEHFSIGNTTANNFGNSIMDILANSTAQTVATPATLVVANTTASAQVGIGTFTLQGTGSNTGLTLGTASKAANGYTFLPNGILIQWGNSNATLTPANITFPTTFPTTCFVVTATANVTSNTAGTVEACAVIPTNTSVFSLKSGNSTTVRVYWMAIGN